MELKWRCVEEYVHTLFFYKMKAYGDQGLSNSKKDKNYIPGHHKSYDSSFFWGELTPL